MMIEGRIYEKSEESKDQETIFNSLKSKIYAISEQNIHRLLTELETGGNIRFEEGKPSDKWYKSCIDLVQSKFSLEDMKDCGIKGI